MAKQGMKRPEYTHEPKNSSYVPEIQGKAKSGKQSARPIIADSDPLRVYHTAPKKGSDKPIPSDIYPEIDSDLARDNLENDITAADLQDL